MECKVERFDQILNELTELKADVRAGNLAVAALREDLNRIVLSQALHAQACDTHRGQLETRVAKNTESNVEQEKRWAKVVGAAAAAGAAGSGGIMAVLKIVGLIG